MTTNPFDDHLLALTAIVTVAYQFAFFFVSYLAKFDKLTDFAGSTNFIVLAVMTLIVGGEYEARQIVTTVCVVIWGSRLGAFLFYRIILWGEDNRFDDKRQNLGRLAAFWILQALWVWTVSLPVTIINSKPSYEISVPSALAYVGWAIFIVGFLIEAVADQQKLWYKEKPESRGRWTDVGVWSWSRHPNYFGEIIIWWGLYLASVRDFKGAEHAAVAGPVFITILLLFVSGVPMLEKSGDRKYGRKEGYDEFKRRTSVIIPIPPALYAPLPHFIKSTILLDLKFYNPGPPDEDNDDSEGEKKNSSQNESSQRESDKKKASSYHSDGERNV